MKSVLINIVFFVVLAIMLSGMSCGDRVSSEKAPNANNAASPLPQTGQTDSKGTEYPPAPSVIMQTEIKTLDGGTFKVEDRKGEVLLLNLWATWCGPCRAEMPELVAMHEKYSDKKFKVIGLNSDNESQEDVDAFVKKMKLNYEIGWADNKIVGEFVRVTRIQAIPQSFLIDREGRLRGVFTGGGPRVIGQMKETVDKVVNE
jgi:thiol-disulfide isomerase/thioredoxin